MQIFNKSYKVKQQIKQWQQQELSIALVPTMGNLHLGHINLIEKAKQKADKVICSVFVNSLQFSLDEDLQSYPRTFEQDKIKLESVNCDMLFVPEITEIYPENDLQINSQINSQTKICVPKKLANILEGKERLEHFNGVATVVCKLFNILQPNVAIFGQKDYQQFIVLQRVTKDLNFAVKLVMLPTIREESGLALSSRNQYLTPKQKQIAPNLYLVLQQIKDSINKMSVITELSLLKLEQEAKDKLLSVGFDKVDYIRILDKNTLDKELSNSPTLVISAVRLGSTRLLDNIEI